MGKFRSYLESNMPAWDDKRPLSAKLRIVRSNPNYSSYTDDQIERLLNYLTAEEIRDMDPDMAFEKANDLQIGVEMGAFDDFDFEDDFSF